VKYIKLFEKFIDNIDNIESELIDLIKRDCAPFLKEFDFPVFRGAHIERPEDIYYNGEKDINGSISSENKFIYSKRKMRHNRYPESTPREIHDDLNESFREKFGVNVRNGIFTSLDYNLAERFGDGDFMFFPIGEYKYYWSPIIRDLWDFISEKLWVRYGDDIPRLNSLSKGQWENGEIYYYNGKDTGCVKRRDFGYFYEYHNEYLNDYSGNYKLDEDLLELKDVKQMYDSYEEYRDFKISQMYEIKESDIEYIVSTYKDSDINELLNNGWKHPVSGDIRPSSNEVTFICNEYYIINYREVIKSDIVDNISRSIDFYRRIKNGK